jgi:hypothetical protein
MTLKLQTQNCQIQTKRKNQETYCEQMYIKLIYETWGSIFDSSDVGSVFNYFCNTYLRILYSSFPIQKQMRK